MRRGERGQRHVSRSILAAEKSRVFLRQNAVHRRFLVSSSTIRSVAPLTKVPSASSMPEWRNVLGYIAIGCPMRCSISLSAPAALGTHPHPHLYLNIYVHPHP